MCGGEVGRSKQGWEGRKDGEEVTTEVHGEVTAWMGRRSVRGAWEEVTAEVHGEEVSAGVHGEEGWGGGSLTTQPCPGDVHLGKRTLSKS